MAVEVGQLAGTRVGIGSRLRHRLRRRFRDRRRRRFRSRIGEGLGRLGRLGLRDRHRAGLNLALRVAGKPALQVLERGLNLVQTPARIGFGIRADPFRLRPKPLRLRTHAFRLRLRLVQYLLCLPLCLVDRLANILRDLVD